MFHKYDVNMIFMERNQIISHDKSTNDLEILTQFPMMHHAKYDREDKT